MRTTLHAYCPNPAVVDHSHVFSQYLFLFPMRDGVPTSHVMGKTPYVEASVGIYNIFKLLHIEYVRRLTYTDIPGVKKGGIRFMILMIF